MERLWSLLFSVFWRSMMDKEFEEALAKEWQDYNKRGAATVDALEDNTQELAFAKGFYRGYLVAVERASEWLENYMKGVAGSSVYVEDFKKFMEE